MRTTLGAAVDDASRRLGGLTESAVATELRRFVRSRPALLALVFCVGIVAVGVFAGSIAEYDPVTTNLRGRLQPPGEAGHILGTDQLGRDVLARVVHGARVSLLVAVAAATMSITVGMVIGTVAGMRGGMVDVILMRWADGQIGFPFLVVAIVLMAVLGGGLVPVILIIGYWGWVWYGRVVRGIVLSTKQKQPSCKSRHRCDRIPMFPCLRHAVEHGQQLPHAGGESQFLRLPGRQKPLVELSNDWVSACRHQSSHVQHSAHSGPSAPGSTPPSVASAIPTEWGHADQSCDLLPA